jgi:hypothetical protein
MKITNDNFKQFAITVAMPQSPEDYSPAAMKRLMTIIDPYVVDVKGISFKFKARNKVELIDFSTNEEAEFYHNTEKRFLEELALIQGKGYPNEQILQLVLLQKFQQAAELIRAPYLAKRMYEIRNKKNRSAVCAFKYKETGAKIVSILVMDYGISRDRISMIWGGMQSKSKGKTGKASKADKMLANMKFDEKDIEFLKSIGIDTPTDLQDISEEQDDQEQKRTNTLLRLGTQSKVQRQSEIDKFQCDKADYCLFTFKSGGVGLSLHQNQEWMRPRETLLAPTYSAMELVQGLGRCPRITSCSDTEQTVVFYANTIEVDVALRVSQKLKCLREVVRSKETWESVIIGAQQTRHMEDNGQTGIISEVEDDMCISVDEDEEDEDSNNNI